MMRAQMDQDSRTSLPNEVKPSSSKNTDVFDFKYMKNSLPNSDHQSDEENHIPVNFHAYAKKQLKNMNDVLHGTNEFSGSARVQPSPTNFYISRGRLGNPCTSHVTKEITGNVSSTQSEDRDDYRRQLALAHFQQRRSARFKQYLQARANDRLNKVNGIRNLIVNREQSESSKKRDVFDLENLRNSLPNLNHQSVKVSHDSQNFERLEVQKPIKVKCMFSMQKELITAFRLRAWMIKRKFLSDKSPFFDGPSTSRATAESTVSNREPQDDFEHLKLKPLRLKKKSLPNREFSRHQRNVDPGQTQLFRLFDQTCTYERLRQVESPPQVSELRLPEAEVRFQPRLNHPGFSLQPMQEIVIENKELEDQIVANIF